MGTDMFGMDAIGERHRGDYAAVNAAMVLIADEAAGSDGEEAIAAAGGRMLQRVRWLDAGVALARIAATPVLMIEAQGVDDATLDAMLPVIRHALGVTGAAAIVALLVGQIDLVAGHLLGGRARLLCEPSVAERSAVLRLTLMRRRPTLHDSAAKGVETDRSPFDHEGARADEDLLRRLIKGMADIRRYADDLIVNQAPPAPLELADRRNAYRAPPTVQAPVVDARDVRRVILHRQQRAKFFGGFGGEALFEDPAWDMLLDLYAAELEGTQVSVSSLCIAAGVAPTTALRWIAKMTSLNLFVRDPDPVDRRRAFMALSPQASGAMRNYMTAINKSDLAG